MNDGALFPNWSSVLQRRAHLLHQQISAMQRLVRDSGGGEEMIERACERYYRLLDEIYEKDMPIARALDYSDLLLHLDGAGLQTESPRLSLVTGIMGDVRKQVGAMIKTLVSSFHEAIELPREFEFGLSSFAKGSLYLGFSLPEPDAGYKVLTGDPLFEASRQALSILGTVTERVNEPNAFDLIRHEFADPKLRDAALSAVGQLAPSGRRGVSLLEIGGRALRPGAWRTLTPQTRLQVREWLDRPVLSEEVIELCGRVRAIDLDLRRFDLRRIDGGNLPDLRCIYPANFDAPAKKWLDATMTVRGQVETYQGAARLLQVQTVTENVAAESN
ncbi:MAG: hypothetical protein LV479_13045 [Methylacidiphilales bacterium]|nr:hypothetical protein [Candidatus Methylacidiphilales bacterium]